MSAAYYNEIDSYAAQWLRNLIAAGHIAPGDVDERSIEDVHPSDLIGYTQCHFFAGIGVWSYALRCAGWRDDRPVWTGSCPCQPFSAAGRRGGTSDKRHLWPAWFRLIAACNPTVVFGEQVASKDGLTWLDIVYADLESASYAVRAVDLCAAGVGAPHIRQRLWFVADSARGGRDRMANTERAAVRDIGRAAFGAASRGMSFADRERQRLRPDAGKHGDVGIVADTDNERCGEARRAGDWGGLGRCSSLSGWPTPLVNDELGSDYCYGAKTSGGERLKFLKLPGAAKLATWPTPKAQDGERGGR